MKVLFTGASSFTGYWFVKELAAGGHDVTMTFTRPRDRYKGIRRKRVEQVVSFGRPVFECRFGDDRFVKLVAEQQQWDLLCHHAADVANYKSPDFDVTAALANNTHNLAAVLAALRERGCRRVVLTGSVFEQNEGAGSEGLPAFSPYGLSKGLTAQVFRYHAARAGLRLGKFVIPNPFGPYEEPRFTAYLVRTWLAGRTAVVKTPAYVRDNIHVSLLAKAYVDFAERLSAEPGFQKINPSGYVESQGRFAERFAENMRGRLSIPCELTLEEQTEFAEPRVRINTDPVDGVRLGWNEEGTWDEIAAFYERYVRTAEPA